MPKNNRPKLWILWTVILSLSAVTAVYALFVATSKVSSECYNISDKDAKAMAIEDLDDGFSSGTSSKIYKEKSINEIVISTIERYSGDKGSGHAYVKLIINNKSTGKRIASANIFEDCAIEWWE